MAKIPKSGGLSRHAGLFIPNNQRSRIPLGPDVLHEFIQDSRSLRGDADTARQSLVALAESVAFNPRGRGFQDLLAEDALRLRRLASIGVHVRGIAGVVNKDYDRRWISPALREDTLADLLDELASLGRLALGSSVMPVRSEAPSPHLSS